MNKKKISIILGVLIIAILLILLIPKDNNIDNDILSNIEEKILNKDNAIIYLTDNTNRCSRCEIGDYLINFYEKIYKIEILKINKSNISSPEYKKILAKLGVNEKNLLLPTIFFLEDGLVKFYTNDISTNETLKENLLNYEYINKELFDLESQIEDDEFEKIYSSTANNLLVWCYIGDTCYNYREKIFKTAKKYKFKYSVIYNGIGDTQQSSNTLRKSIDTQSYEPLLLIVNNNKIIDYTSSNDEAAIKKFLKKNTIIK